MHTAEQPEQGIAAGAPGLDLIEVDPGPAVDGIGLQTELDALDSHRQFDAAFRKICVNFFFGQDGRRLVRMFFHAVLLEVLQFHCQAVCRGLCIVAVGGRRLDLGGRLCE